MGLSFLEKMWVIIYNGNKMKVVFFLKELCVTQKNLLPGNS